MPTPFDHDQDAVRLAGAAADLNSLLVFDDAEFVAVAYRTFLLRAVEPDGLIHYTRWLRAGYTRLDVVAALCKSREGRSKGVRLPGLDAALRNHRLSRLPLIGPLVSHLGRLEGHSARDRSVRAIESAHRRQELADAARHQQLLQAVQAIAAVPGPGPASAASDELIAPVNGQTPSLLSRFIRLERVGADEVISELGQRIRAGREAEILSRRCAA
ncbi:MAG: DUF4214 domain-containing protein [Ideonella sp.]